MGTDKAMVTLDGVPLVRWVASALNPVVDRLAVVGRTGSVDGLEAVPDDHRGRGPLGGIVTALRLARGEPVLAVAVDQPFARTETLRRLVELAEPDRAVVPIDHHVRQVTCAIYPAEWAVEAAKALAGGLSIQGLLDRLVWSSVLPDEWRSWGEDGRSWFSVDTLQALEEGQRRYGSLTHRRSWA